MHAPLAMQHSGSPPCCALTMAAMAGAQLSSAERLLSLSASNLAVLSETASPEKPAHGLAGVRDPDGTFRLPTPRVTSWPALGDRRREIKSSERIDVVHLRCPQQCRKLTSSILPGLIVVFAVRDLSF